MIEEGPGNGFDMKYELLSDGAWCWGGGRLPEFGDGGGVKMKSNRAAPESGGVWWGKIGGVSWPDREGAVDDMNEFTSIG